MTIYFELTNYFCKILPDMAASTGLPPSMPWMAVQTPTLLSSLARPVSPLLQNSAHFLPKPLTTVEISCHDLADTVRLVTLAKNNSGCNSN